MKTIKFDNRRAMPRGIRIGVEMDNNVEQVKFELPKLAAGQTETLYWRNGGHADAVLLADGVWTITNAITAHPGEAVCYIAISDGGSTLWHSETFSVCVFNLPGTERAIEQTCPTAIQTAVDLAARAGDRLEAASEATRAAAYDLTRGAYLNRDVSLNGRVYQTLRPPHFDLHYPGHALMADNGQVVVREVENWDMYRYDFGQRMVLRVDDLARNPAIQGVLPLAYELENGFYPLDLNNIGGYITADALLTSVMKTQQLVEIAGEDGETTMLTPANFTLSSAGHALMAEDGVAVVQEAENWNLYRHAFGARRTIRIGSLAKNPAIQGVLPMVYERDSVYYALDLDAVNTVVEADALLTCAMKMANGGTEAGVAQTLTPSSFTRCHTNKVIWMPEGSIVEGSIENWHVYRYDFATRTTLTVNSLTKNSRIQGVLPLAYELAGMLYPLDLDAVDTVITADALLTNYWGNNRQYAFTSVSFTPTTTAAGPQPETYQYAIESMGYAPVQNSGTRTVTELTCAMDHISFTADARRDFDNAVVCREHMGDFDSIVCFGDSIFHGRFRQNNQLTEQGNGVMQQFAALMNLPLTNCAVSGATLSTEHTSPKNVVQQVTDWTPEAGRTPLILIDGGTNDQFFDQLVNLGEYGDEDASTVYGAIKAVVNILLVKGVQPWQIVITTPIPKGVQGSGAYTASVDAQLTAIGYAMYQTGVAMGCSVINGYGSVFGNLDNLYAKWIMMEDDTHPTEKGAMYYAHYIYDALCGRLGTLDRAANSLAGRAAALETGAASLAAQLAAKADTDGYYEALTAGNAEQLISTVTVTDKTPYSFRTSGGSADIGDRETDALVGGTLAWNQLVGNGAASVTVESGHRYIARVSGTWTCANGGGSGIAVTGGTDVLFDLTRMFGSTIADYVYGLEQATAGAGVAWFRKLFPKDYYAYNAGELMSVNAASHDTIGFNQWDEEWEVGGIDNATGINNTASNVIRSKNVMRAIPGATYCLSPSIAQIYWYNGSNYIGFQYNNLAGNLIEAPANATKFRFVTKSSYGAAYKNDICINFSLDGSRDGEYEPCVKHSYPLDHSLTLRGIPKLDESNALYYDGDIYASDGTVTRRYGIVDLGALEWTYQPAYTRFYCNPANMKPITSQYIVPVNYMMSKYTPLRSYDFGNLGTDKAYCIFEDGRLLIRDTSYSDAATFKTAMSGVYFVYELATPTTEAAESFQNPQIVDDWGTEAYVDYAESQGARDVAIPVGHETKYMNNLRAKLEMAPESPSGDGDYILRRTGGMNAYVAYDGGGRLTALEAKLPAPPTANGAYTLTVTVSGGTATYNWESAT